MQVFKRITGAIDRISDTLANIASWLTLAMILMVTYEVFARYLANKPTVWSMELCQFAFTYIIALGGAYTLRTNGHVSVDILYRRFGKRTQSAISIFTTVLVIGFLIILVYQTGVMAFDALASNEHTGTAFNPLTFPVKAIIPLGVFVLVLQAFVSLIRFIQAAFDCPDPREVATAGKEERD
jgi:TRAP-type mannitol/chloroaromatic compound transport system permease small subunit